MIETYNDVVHVTGKQVKENGYKKAVEERKISAIKLKVASRVVGFVLSLPFSLPPPPLSLSHKINDTNKFRVTMANRLISIQQLEFPWGREENSKRRKTRAFAKTIAEIVIYEVERSLKSSKVQVNLRHGHHLPPTGQCRAQWASHVGSRANGCWKTILDPCPSFWTPARAKNDLIIIICSKCQFIYNFGIIYTIRSV